MSGLGERLRTALGEALLDACAVLVDDACACGAHELDGAGGPACAACRGRLAAEGAGNRCARCSAVLVDPAAATCLACAGGGRRPVPVEAPRAHAGVARTLVHALKYGRRRHVADALAEVTAQDVRVARALADADLVVPAPSEPVRRRERGFDPAELLARGLADRATGPEGRRLAVRRLLALRRGVGRQVGRPAAQRRTALRGAVLARPLARLLVRGRRVVLVDDVVTTGATATEAARVLRRLGARSVRVVAVTRAPGTLVPEPRR